MMALERHRSSTDGVLVESVRVGSGAGTAKLPLQGEDIILRVDGQPVKNIAALKRVTEKIMKGKNKQRPVLVEFARDTKQWLTLVKLGHEEDKNNPASTKKPWSGVAVQVLTPDLAEALGLQRPARG